jgi:hypothetical protein
LHCPHVGWADSLSEGTRLSVLHVLQRSMTVPFGMATSFLLLVMYYITLCRPA